MEINYGRMLSDYFMLNAKYRKMLKESSEKNAEYDRLREKMKETEGEVPSEATARRLRETEAVIQKTQELLEKSKRKVDTMSLFLRDFSVSVADAFQVLFPQIRDADLYEITCESSFARFCPSPLSLNEVLNFYDAQPKSDDVPLFKIKVKNRRTFKEECFYKFGDIDEEMEDGSPIRSHLSVILQSASPSPIRYRMPFVLERERIFLLKFNFKDFHYSAQLMRHAFEIAEAKRRRVNG